MMTILLERQEFLRATLLPWQTKFLLGDGSRIEIVSKCHRQFTSIDSSIVKGPIRL